MSGTMLVAHKMGIPLFVTGGIGGVHRFGETSEGTVACRLEKVTRRLSCRLLNHTHTNNSVNKP